MTSAGGRWRRSFALIVPGALVAALSACTNENPSLRIVSVVPPANAPIRFSDVQLIFDRSCAKSGCHVTGVVPQGLNLESGMSYALLVGVRSTEDSSFYRVEPCAVEPCAIDQSYLIKKIEGTQTVGPRMPPDGSPFLPEAEVQVIKDWIKEGAPND